MNAREARRRILFVGRGLAWLAATAFGGEWEPRVYDSDGMRMFDVVCTKTGFVTHHGKRCDVRVGSGEGITHFKMQSRTWAGLYDRVSIADMVARAAKNEHWQ